MKPTSLFVGIPSYDGWKQQFGITLFGAFQKMPCATQVYCINGDSLIPRARNNLAREFLKTDHSHLLFLDCDLEFPPDAISRLVSHDRPIVGGCYQQKRYDMNLPVANWLGGEQVDADGLIRVRHVGTGMMLIAREVFEKLVKDLAVDEFGTCSDEKDQGRMFDFFPIGVDNGEKKKLKRIRLICEDALSQWQEDALVSPSQLLEIINEPCGDIYESEDWAFCRLATESGFDVWVDTQVSAWHHGAAKYPNDAVEQLRRIPAEVEAALVELEKDKGLWSRLKGWAGRLRKFIHQPLVEPERR